MFILNIEFPCMTENDLHIFNSLWFKPPLYLMITRSVLILLALHTTGAFVRGPPSSRRHKQMRVTTLVGSGPRCPHTRSLLPIIRSALQAAATDSPEVLCVGDALFDCIANNEAKGWPISRVLDEGAWTAFPGGAPANVATALVKLGTASTFAGCLGADADGDALQALLEEVGVDTSLVTRSVAKPTRRIMVERALDGERSFACFADGAQPCCRLADTREMAWFRGATCMVAGP